MVNNNNNRFLLVGPVDSVVNAIALSKPCGQPEV